MPILKVTHEQVMIHRAGDPMPKAGDRLVFESPTGRKRKLKGFSLNSDFKPIFEKTLNVNNETKEIRFSVEEMKVIVKYSDPI